METGNWCAISRLAHIGLQRYYSLSLTVFLRCYTYICMSVRRFDKGINLLQPSSLSITFSQWYFYLADEFASDSGEFVVVFFGSDFERSLS